MIIDLIVIVITLFLSIIHGLLSLLNFVIPNQIAEAIEVSIGYTAYLTGILPVQEIMTAMLSFLSFLIVWYGAKLVMKIFHMLPWVGKKVDLK